jgi:hypothetical protein
VDTYWLASLDVRRTSAGQLKECELLHPEHSSECRVVYMAQLFFQSSSVAFRIWLSGDFEPDLQGGVQFWSSFASSFHTYQYHRQHQINKNRN